MTEWIRGLAAPERRAFIAAFGGWTMDAMDYQAFSFVIPRCWRCGDQWRPSGLAHRLCRAAAYVLFLGFAFHGPAGWRG